MTCGLMRSRIDPVKRRAYCRNSHVARILVLAGEWALNINSVEIFGGISLVTDIDKTRKVGIGLCKKFTDDRKTEKS